MAAHSEGSVESYDPHLTEMLSIGVSGSAPDREGGAPWTTKSLFRPNNTAANIVFF